MCWDRVIEAEAKKPVHHKGARQAEQAWDKRPAKQADRPTELSQAPVAEEVQALAEAPS